MDYRYRPSGSILDSAGSGSGKISHFPSLSPSHPRNGQWHLSLGDNDQIHEDFMEEVRRKKIMNGEISLLGVMKVSRVSQVFTAVAKALSHANRS